MSRSATLRLGLAALLTLVVAQVATPDDRASPLGVWIDDTGQGAVEIKDCGGKLCGHLVWLKSARNASQCNLAIIGDLASGAGGTWTNGWIYDPRSKSKFDVEITPAADGKLSVTGYAGMKTISRTMVWTKAPADLVRCDARPVIDAGAGATTQTAMREPTPAPAAPTAAASPPKAKATRTAASRHSGRHKPSSERLAALGNYGLSDVTMRKSRGSCSLRISDFGSVGFPC